MYRPYEVSGSANESHRNLGVFYRNFGGGHLHITGLEIKGVPCTRLAPFGCRVHTFFVPVHPVSAPYFRVHVFLLII